MLLYIFLLQINLCKFTNLSSCHTAQSAVSDDINKTIEYKSSVLKYATDRHSTLCSMFLYSAGLASEIMVTDLKALAHYNDQLLGQLSGAITSAIVPSYE
jgi:hypothetical protein